MPTPLPSKLESQLSSSSSSSTSASSDHLPIDPFHSGVGYKNDVGTAELDRNTVRNRPIDGTDVEESYGAPPNPFHKTLESLETGGSASTDSNKTVSPQSKAAESRKSGIARGSMDVDAFKRMLLTGSPSANPSKASALASHLPGGLGDSSSGTDTSSVSRQSIFEPTLETQIDTPRTSHEINASDDENQKTGREWQKERAKPAPPRARYGKPLRSLSQQSTLSISKTQATPNINITPQSQASKKSGSDDALPSLSKSNSEAQANEALSPSRSSSGRKAPAPPLSRRHSHLVKAVPSGEERAEQLREARARNVEGARENSPAKSPAPPPPPPPSRRTLQSNRHSMIITGQSTPPSATEGMDDPLEMTRTSSNISMPPPPPPPPARSSSISSNKRPFKPSQSSTSASPSSTTTTPPVPPPRRRASSRSSVEVYARSEANRRSSGSLLEESIEDIDTKSAAGNKDVLADLSALQREVDELRGKFER